MNGIQDLERKLEQLLREPSDYRLFNGIGVLLYQMKDWSNAGRYLQRAYELNPEDREVLYNYALLLYSQSQWDNAITVLKEYLKLEQYDREALEKAGDAFCRLGDYEAAARMYERLGEIIGGGFPAHEGE